LDNNNLIGWRRHFIPDNRIRTYKIASTLGAMTGGLLFVAIAANNSKIFKTDVIFQNALVYPLFGYVVLALSAAIFRDVRKKVRLGKKQDDLSIARGLIESCFRFIGMLGFIYYILAAVTIKILSLIK
jgi:hypothetical protein